MAYRLTVIFSDGNEEIHYFHEKSSAEQSMLEWEEGYDIGREVLAMAGESFQSNSIRNIEIDEIDDFEVEDYEFDD